MSYCPPTIDEAHKIVMVREEGSDETTSSVTAVCALCSTVHQLWWIASTTAEGEEETALLEAVQAHISSPHHLALAEEAFLMCVESMLPVELNGIPMLLDHNLIFPAAMFGPGRQLYDLSLQALKVPDSIGAVQLQPYHRYLVTESVAAVDAVSRPKKVQSSMKYFARKRRARKGLIVEFNRLVRAEAGRRRLRNRRKALLWTHLWSRDKQR